ncbi:MAG: hypothetical protein JRJ69_18300 [Deltaproteobacteria bacterium]|nr:hypothetical protein [Deltaproteobacteria bacterium]
MNILAMIPVIGKILDKGLSLIDKYVEDKDKANELKAMIQREVLINQHEELAAALESQTKIILAEARGGWLQRNWRPLLMLIVILIIANNYVIAPYIALFLPGKSLILDLTWGLADTWRADRRRRFLRKMFETIRSVLQFLLLIKL